MAKKLKWEIVGGGITTTEVPVGPLSGKDREEIDRRIGPEDSTMLPEQAAWQILADAGITGTLEEIAKHPAVSKGELVSLEWFAFAILETIAAIRDGKDVVRDAFNLGVLVVSGGMKYGHEANILAHDRSRAGAAEGGSKEKKIRPVMEWLRDTIKQYPDKPYTFYWNSLPDHDDGDPPARVNGATLIREGGVLVARDGRSRFLTLPSFRRYVADVKESLRK